jgi:hypothetical protein
LRKYVHFPNSSFSFTIITNIHLNLLPFIINSILIYKPRLLITHNLNIIGQQQLINPSTIQQPLPQSLHRIIPLNHPHPLKMPKNFLSQKLKHQLSRIIEKVPYIPSQDKDKDQDHSSKHDQEKPLPPLPKPVARRDSAPARILVEEDVAQKDTYELRRQRAAEEEVYLKDPYGLKRQNGRAQKEREERPVSFS